MATPDGTEPEIRPYRSPDDAAATYVVARTAIARTAATAYDPDQIAAWLGPARLDLTGWDERRHGASTLVAELDGIVVGFADLRSDGLVDMLFVDPRAGGRGVARALLTVILHDAEARGIAELRTYASRSARPVFERLGFTVVADRPDNTVRGVVVPNTEMRRLP
ncbi:GNAT family N-acetyltransferase [Cellulosimicrobium sp. NPDC057127]|uniref:GNAT family N-acetyltransferase n=1 Tax=Cellulosimicrobium sp. NPDC057127 TaxID=3346026 RepID=UPI00363056C3